ncbi:MBL fold metallo-hydrolase [Poritiphilus flavus]|uniref:Pyrroloquinoline quinone biosynthesis protein PqqB n=1 Tax=Poritiphilus flavus TaxID=2697053 RepID=A0A6L9E8P7_9FLAO|nr:MBL fold metallo-hydrolase [Poritiphilus flavus]NAS11024.1 pyrroloquinoline quinone biosynthesis protein PqqB [Poritiphilus flavus]
MRFLKLLLILCLFCCKEKTEKTVQNSHFTLIPSTASPYIQVLGTVQDAGSPQLGCTRDCCKDLFLDPDETRKAVSLALVDPEFGKSYLFEATPDIGLQLRVLKEDAPIALNEIPNGIFLTHAHIGHYSGLQFFGMEAANTNGAKVFAMPRMQNFLKNNGPWSQLVSRGNIKIQALQDRETIVLGPNLSVTPFTVPHRDEYSETVGYRIKGSEKSVLFIPDIDKWSRWDQDIIKLISEVDYAFLDATFFSTEEVGHRDISEIPHPLVSESLDLFKELEPKEKEKVFFIHFNHTNPLLDSESPEAKMVMENGFGIAQFKQRITL